MASATSSRAALPVFQAPDEIELLSGVEALVRIPIEQHLADSRAGLRTATLISGYPGSPLGTVDLTLERDHKRMAEHDVTHVPGVNEELAAATVWGSQQTRLMADSEFDGVVGLWYGKSPGVDRCGDVFKHANSMGTSRNGGVLVAAGDDPSAKSSTLPNDSRFALLDANMPLLTPATVGEVLQLGLHGIAISRFSGLWTGLRVQTNQADGFASMTVADLLPDPVLPEVIVQGRPWVHVQVQKVDNTVSILQEEQILNGRMEAARAYSAANGLNRVTHGAGEAWLGFVAVGKAHSDLLEALARLGLSGRALDRAGIRILKVSMPFPLAPGAVRSFADGLEEIVIVEEKRPFVETFVRDILYGYTHRPPVYGKRDERGDRLIPGEAELTPERLVPMIVARAGRRVSGLRPPPPAAAVNGRGQTLPLAPPAKLPARVPAYCSGCPHNKSTAGPDGAIIGGGVGCHSIVYLEERHAEDIVLALTPMGSEGVPWIGISRYAKTPHMFQNLGDGTLAHSGSTAIRACIAAKVDMTFKILYNDAIAMTGGQHVAGLTSVPDLTRELEAMGVSRLLVLTDDPSKYGRDTRWARGVTVWSRDRLTDAETLLAETKGVSVLIYDERCKAEARRLWKRGELERPSTRVMINEAVCEGCGDCQVKSNCLSVLPVDTPLGRKTQIHQPSCNHDLTCVTGDCPSFVTIDTDTVEKRDISIPEPPSDLPPPDVRAASDRISAYMVGIGGTGVVTTNRVLASAALRDGFVVSGLDQTGLSQKAGAVTSHLRATRGEAPLTNTVGEESCDVYLAFDSLTGAEPRHLSRIRDGETLAVVNSALVPTISTITQAYDPLPDPAAFRGAIEARAKSTVSCDSERISELLFGDNMAANVLMLGVAYQSGALPLTVESIESALQAMGRAAATSVKAFRWGRTVVVRPQAVESAIAPRLPSQSRLREPSAGAAAAGEALLASSSLTGVVRDLAEWRVKDLCDYQGRSLARRYLRDLERIALAEAERGNGRTELGAAVAFQLYKLIAYKDEYEVARLHLDARFRTDLEREFPGASVRVQLHPPILRALGMKQKIAVPRRLADGIFHVLHRMRRLRGTPFDPFGAARARRLERSLPAEFLGCVEDALARSYDEALLVATAAAEIRGYEEIKLRGVERFRLAVGAARASAQDERVLA
jgi:indolepyruvate ferredoxin oxidoreductase